MLVSHADRGARSSFGQFEIGVPAALARIRLGRSPPMKKLATFVTASLLGITSIASAKPAKPPTVEVSGHVSVTVGTGITVTTSSTAGSAHASGTLVIRDHRNPPPLIVRPIRNQWLKNHWKQVKPKPVVVQPDRPVI